MVLSMERWEGKVAVVTGASSGIGAAIAHQLVEEGLLVVGLARRSTVIEKNAKDLLDKKGKLYAYKANMTKEDDLIKAFKWVRTNVGPVHVLVNNAGVNFDNTLIDGDAEKWRQTFNVNVIGLSIATREAIKQMKAENIHGHIFHINSMMGHKVPNFPVQCLNAYPASKFAVTALADTLRQEISAEKLNIKITSISPGLVESEISIFNENAERREMFKHAPILKAEDVADALRYALSTPEHVQIHELIISPRKIMV